MMSPGQLEGVGREYEGVLVDVIVGGWIRSQGWESFGLGGSWP